MMREAGSAQPAPGPGQRRALPVSRFTSYRAVDYLLALIAGLLAFTLYCRTLAPGLLGGDSGEFQFAAWLGGFVHPTGYPLYLLLGHAWTHLLPLGDPAWRMNLFSAFWGGLAVGLTYLLAARLLGSSVPARGWPPAVTRLAALFAALMFAVTPTFWSQAIIAEVYSLHAVLVIAVLLGLVTWYTQPADRRSYTPLYWTAVAYGLGLAHHRTMLLLAPAIAVFFWLERRGAGGWRLRSAGLARALPLVLLPLLLYLYIPIRAPRVPYARVTIGPDQTLELYRPSVDWFIAHVSGRLFSSAMRPASEAVRQLIPGVGLLRDEISWVGVVLGVLGLVWLGRRARSLLALTGLYFVATVGFNLFYGIGDIFVFYIPAYLVWVLWMAQGVTALAELLGGFVRRFPPGLQAVAYLLPCILAFLVPVQLLLEHYPHVDQSHNDRARSTWRAILDQPIPSNAILISNDRDEIVPLWYLQFVEGVRRDLTGVFPLIQSTPDWADVGQVVTSARRSGRPVLLIKPMPGLETKFQLEPAGSLERVVGLAVDKLPEEARAVDFGDAVRLTGYDLEPDLLSGGGDARVTLYWQPLRQMRADYTSFVHLVNADGAVVGQSDHRPGGVYYPTSLWRPGELIKDIHELALASDLGRPPYAIEVGLYRMNSGLEHLGKPERVGNWP